MDKIKAIINIFDITIMLMWGLNTIDLVTALLTNLILSGFDGFIKILFSIVGFIYLIIRVYWFHKKNTLEHKIKEKSLKDD